MTHFISGLMSWMNRDSRRNELLTWAQTEYKKDWRFAYNFMLTHDGRAPSWSEMNLPSEALAKKLKEVA